MNTVGPAMHRCGFCGQEWWDAHICPPKPAKHPNNELREAAAAVVARWDTPLWKDAPATAIFIARLRAALEAA